MVSNSFKNRLNIFQQHHDVVSNDGEVSEDLEGSNMEGYAGEVIMDESPKANKEDLYNFGEKSSVADPNLYNFGDQQ